MKLRIEGMTCSHCARAVEEAIQSVGEGLKVRVNYLKKEALVQGEAPMAALVRAVEEAGYRAIPLEAGDAGAL